MPVQLRPVPRKGVAGAGFGLVHDVDCAIQRAIRVWVWATGAGANGRRCPI